MQREVHDLIGRQRSRAIRGILEHCERDVHPHLTNDQIVALRKRVLDELNDFTAVILDVFEAIARDDVLLNGAWLEKLDELHRYVVGDPV